MKKPTPEEAMFQAYSPANSLFSKRMGTTVASHASSSRPGTSYSAGPSRQNLGHSMERGEYDELICRQQQVEAQKREDRENMVNDMLTTQAEELVTLEATHNLQFQLFTANSDSLLEGARKKCQRSEDVLLSKHADEAVTLDNSTGIDSMKMRPSKAMMELKKKEERMLQNQDFVGADKMRASAELLEAAEMQSHMQNWMVKRDLEETKMLQRQAKELKAIRLKSSSIVTEAVLQQGRELEKLQKRLAAAKLALSKQHNKERQMVEQSLNGNHFALRASFKQKYPGSERQTTSSGSTYASSRGTSAAGARGPGFPSHVNPRARPMTSPHAGRSRNQNPSAPGYPPEGPNPREAWSKSGDTGPGSAGYTDVYADTIPLSGTATAPTGTTRSQSHERNTNQTDLYEDQAAMGNGVYDDGGQTPRTPGGRPAAHTIHSDNYIGPRAVNMDRALMPRGVFERMKESKEQQERSKRSARLSSGRSGGQSGGHDPLTSLNLVAHEQVNSGGGKGGPPLRGQHGAAPPTPSGFDSNCNQAGSGIRPHTAGPPPLRTF